VLGVGRASPHGADGVHHLLWRQVVLFLRTFPWATEVVRLVAGAEHATAPSLRDDLPIARKASLQRFACGACDGGDGELSFLLMKPVEIMEVLHKHNYVIAPDSRLHAKDIVNPQHDFVVEVCFGASRLKC